MSGSSAVAGGKGHALDAPALPRVPLAIAAALLVHVAVLTGARVGATATPATAAPPLAMTVRAIPSELPTSSLNHSPPSAESPSAASDSQLGGSPSELVASPKLASRSEPAAAPTKALPPAADARLTGGAEEAGSTSTARPPVATAPADTKPDGSDRTAALPPAPDYLFGASLDPGPQPIGDIEPEYPASAKLQEGRVVIRVLISDDGKVDNVAVVRAVPPGLFEAAALEAFGKARFTPGRVAGVAVKTQVTVEVHFLPINRGSRISGRGY